MRKKDKQRSGMESVAGIATERKLKGNMMMAEKIMNVGSSFIVVISVAVVVGNIVGRPV